MELGDSFFVETTPKDLKRQRDLLNIRYYRYKPKKFTLRTITENGKLGLRVWRIEKHQYCNMIKIDKNIPIPSRIGMKRAVVMKLNVGDSFFVPVSDPKNKRGLSSYLSTIHQKYKFKKFTQRFLTENGITGYRVWRIK